MSLHSLFTATPETASIRMKERQQPLMEDYRHHPENAMVFDYGCTSSEWTSPNNPLATTVHFDKSDLTTAVGVHTAVGGDSDNPTPGDILCGAMACCLDSTIRIIANRFDLSLKKLSVEVTGKVDVRGTLRVDPDVPVAFQSFEVVVDIKTKRFIPSKYIDKLLAGAEHSCIVIQSLRGNCDITVRRK